VEVFDTVDGVKQSLGTVKADATGHWTFTAAAALAEGAHSITTTATDAAGNTSSAGAAATFSVVTTAPAVPSAATVLDNVAGGLDGSTTPALGSILEAGLSNDATPTFSGSATAGDTISVYYDPDRY
jgi:hypothetical protein